MKKIFLLLSLLFSVTCFAQVPTYVPSNGIVAFWPFSGNANDATGNGNNGTVNGATLTTDRLGFGNAAYYFSNTAAPNAYIQANVNTASITASGAMTLSFWVYRVGNGYLGARVMEFGSCTTCAGQILVGWGNGSTSMTFRHYLTATDFTTYNFSGLADNTWYNIVYTNDGTTAKYYLNGILVNSVASPDPAQLLGNVAFGRMNHPSNDAFNGNLDDIGIWNRALSPCEVNALYTGTPAAAFAYNALQDTTFTCDSIMLDAGSGYSNYAWSTGDNTQTIYASHVGLYKITVTNAAGCTATDSTQVIVIKPTISQNDTTVCSGTPVPLTANGIAGSSQTLVDNFFISALSYNTHSVTTTIGQSYIMKVSGTWSVHGCPGSDPNNPADAAFYLHSPFPALPNNLDWVIWNGVPIRPDGNTYDAVNNTYTYTLPPSTQVTQTFASIDLSDNATHTNPGAYSDNCGGLTFTISQVNKSNAIYTWSAIPAATAGLNASDINNQSLTVKPIATTSYYVIVNDGITSCEDSVLITVATIDTSITASDPLNICSNGGVVHLHAGINASYQWLLNGTPIPAATNKDYTVTQTGAYRVIGFTAAGCSDTSRALTIGLYPQPIAGFTISPSTTQCLQGNSFAFTNTSTISVGTLTYKWNFGDGNGSVTTDATHSYTIANPSYTVRLIDSSNNGCLDTTQQNVVVKSPDATPTVTPGGPVSFCVSGTQTLTSSVVSGNQWYNNGAIIPAAVSQTYNATAAGTYNVISTNTCASDSSNDVVINITPTPPTPTITASGSLLICGLGSVTLASSASTGNKWYDNGSPIIGATNQTYTAVAGGNYHVVVTVNACPSNASADSTVTVVALPNKPIITSTGSDSICQGGSVLLSSSETSGIQWYQNLVPITGATTDTYSASAAGSYTVGISNVCAGDISDPTIVVIVPSPKGIRYAPVNVQVGTAFTLQARTFGDYYLWTPATGLSDYNISDPITDNFMTTQDYLIQIKTNANCITYDSLLVKAYNVKGILIPTAFSPNGDGLNDKLYPTLINIEKLIYFRIFNKWGQMIFQSSSANDGWDGNYQGVRQPIGNYVWIAEGVDADGKTVTDHGSVMIVR